MQLKKLKKRLTKQQRVTRGEYIAHRKAGTQVTQSKDILYHGARTKILRERPQPIDPATKAVAVNDD